MAESKVIPERIKLSDTAPSTQAHDDAAAAGSTEEVSRSGHKHGMPSDVSVTVGGTPTTQVFGDTPVSGSSGDAADKDHKHGMPTLTKVVTLTDEANIATDASLGSLFTVTLAGNRTLDNPTNPTDGQRATWRFKQDVTGSRTISLGSVFRLGTDITAITLTTTASLTDYMGAIYNGDDAKWDIVAFVKGY